MCVQVMGAMSVSKMVTSTSRKTEDDKVCSQEFDVRRNSGDFKYIKNNCKSLELNRHQGDCETVSLSMSSE